MNNRSTFLKRKKRVAGSFVATGVRKRLSVFRSNKHIYAQIIDDKSARTLMSVSDMEKKGKAPQKSAKKDKAALVGEKIAEKALKKGIKNVYFDRSGYKYHGRVKAVADGARKAGLNF